MNLKFVPSIPENSATKTILISGKNSKDLQQSIYLIDEDSENSIAYEIKYQWQCSPFEEAKIIDNLLVVGHQEHFYIYDLIKNLNILALEIKGYFGYLYFYGAIFYVAGAYGIYAINKNGKLIWKNTGLAVDGVIIKEFTESKIFGIAELDPPGGWENFVLDRNNGRSSS
nr:hypothetical protein [uncultured Flavobacterium sp.]